MKHAIHWNLLSPFIRNALLLAGLISAGLAVGSRYGWIVLGGLVALALIVLQGTRLFMTRRRLAEQYRLVLLQKKRLREGEFRWKFAIEGSGDGLWDWNVADGTVFFSAQYKQMLGLTVDEMAH